MGFLAAQQITIVASVIISFCRLWANEQQAESHMPFCGKVGFLCAEIRHEKPGEIRDWGGTPASSSTLYSNVLSGIPGPFPTLLVMTSSVARPFFRRLFFQRVFGFARRQTDLRTRKARAGFLRLLVHSTAVRALPGLTDVGRETRQEKQRDGNVARTVARQQGEPQCGQRDLEAAMPRG